MSQAALLERDLENGELHKPPFRYEVVDGIEVETPPMSIYSEKVATRTLKKLMRWLDDHDIGEAEYEALYQLPLPKKQNRRPDVSFVSYERWPKDRPNPYRGTARDVVPNLAVEVISPSDLVQELTTKIGEFFRAGVELVWVVHCNVKQVHIYTSLDMVRILKETDELDGGEVLPGFRVQVASLFPPVIPPEPLPSDE